MRTKLALLAVADELALLTEFQVCVPPKAAPPFDWLPPNTVFGLLGDRLTPANWVMARRLPFRSVQDLLDGSKRQMPPSVPSNSRPCVSSDIAWAAACGPLLVETSTVISVQLPPESVLMKTWSRPATY